MFATILLIIIPTSLIAVDVFPFLGVFYPCRFLPTSKRREKFQDIHNAGIGHLFTHSYVCIIPTSLIAVDVFPFLGVFIPAGLYQQAREGKSFKIFTTGQS